MITIMQFRMNKTSRSNALSRCSGAPPRDIPKSPRLLSVICAQFQNPIGIMAAVGAGENVTLQVTGVIGAVGACVAYILAEGYADGSNLGNEDYKGNNEIE